MRSRESGALQFSACLVRIWPPHRCRIRDSRSLLEAIALSIDFPMLWIFSMRSRETGALQFSAMLDGGWPPHRCRIKDWRSSLEAKVSRVIFVAVIAGKLACARGMHKIHVGEEC
jgi:hypothetical protein